MILRELIDLLQAEPTEHLELDVEVWTAVGRVSLHHWPTTTIGGVGESLVRVNGTVLIEGESE
jgi:hypothetical protein